MRNNSKNNKDMQNDYLIIKNLVEQLEQIFLYNDDDILIYDNNIQNKVNDLLTKIAILTDTFNNNIINETKNIKEELYIIDSSTNTKRYLIDIDTLDKRVKEVLKINNMFSCLKSLALSNKCAHSFDGNIDKISNSFKKYYNFLYSNIGNKKITFFKSLNSEFPEIQKSNLFDLTNVDDYKFDSICKTLFSDVKTIKKANKISILKQLNIIFDIRNDDAINLKFNKLMENSKILINEYLIKKYEEGMQQIDLQNKMFMVKDNFISMIGQILEKVEFENIQYELIKTENATPGFEYMLIIDDKDLSYYVETHMPNFIAKTLINKFNLKYSHQRTTKKLGASAVYYRDKEEMKEIKKELDNENINTSTRGIARAEIISRDVSSASENDAFPLEHYMVDNGDNGPNENFSIEEDNEYRFITYRIVDQSSYIEEYLINMNIYRKEVKNNQLMLHNENIPSNITKNIVYNNYLNIYDMLEDNNKINFISYSLAKMKNADAFEKTLFNAVTEKMDILDLKTISKIIIYKNENKQIFNDTYSFEIYNIFNDNNINNNIERSKQDDKHIYNQKKEKINNIIYDYVNNYIEEELGKEFNDNGPKRKK